MNTQKFLLSVLIMVVFLTGCSTPPAQPIEVTRIVQEMVLITQIVVVTATPIPPTPAPQATSTSTFARWTIDQASAAISAAGLEFDSPRPMTADDYGLAPFLGQGVRFLIPSLGPDSGGRLFAFSSQADLDVIRDYYESMAKQSALFFSWVFVQDNILIQINSELPESTALQYQQALQATE